MGYTIDQLAGKEAVLGSEVIPVHEGTTNKAPVSLLDQGIVITEGGGTNTGIIRKNKSYVLMNDDSDISLNLQTVLGKKKNPENNTYEDDAEAGAGIIVTILNASARAHYVVSGSEGYKLEPTQSVQLLWSGSKFVRLLPEFLNDYYNKQTVDTLVNARGRFFTTTKVISGVQTFTWDLSDSIPVSLEKGIWQVVNNDYQAFNGYVQSVTPLGTKKLQVTLSRTPGACALRFSMVY